MGRQKAEASERADNYHEVTDATKALVVHRSRLGLPHKMIAAQLNISEGKLTKEYRDELDRGSADGTEQVAGALMGLALGDPANGVPPHPASCMFWMKCRAGWRETNRTEITGPDGTALNPSKPETQDDLDYGTLTMEELLLIEKIEREAAARGNTGGR